MAHWTFSVVFLVCVLKWGYSCFTILCCVSFCWYRNELAICIHISPPSWTSLSTRLLSHPSGSAKSAELNFLCFVAVPSSCLFYPWQCIFVSPNLPVHPCLPAHAPVSTLHSLHPLLLRCRYVHLYHFSSFLRYALNIWYLFLSFWPNYKPQQNITLWI